MDSYGLPFRTRDFHWLSQTSVDMHGFQVKPMDLNGFPWFPWMSIKFNGIPRKCMDIEFQGSGAGSGGFPDAGVLRSTFWDGSRGRRSGLTLCRLGTAPYVSMAMDVCQFVVELERNKLFHSLAASANQKVHTKTRRIHLDAANRCWE